MDKEAKIVIRAEGDDEVARAAGRIDSAWRSAGAGIGSTFKGAAGAVTEAAASMLSDLGHVATVAGSISFAGSLQNVHALEEGFARMGVGSGRSIQSVQSGINQLATDLNAMPDTTAAWVSSVGQLTFSYERAAQAAKGSAEYAALTGQTLQQTQGLAVAIGQVGGQSVDASHAIEVMVAQAQHLGTVGGPKALGDMFQHLAGQVSGVSADLQKTTALLAGFGGDKGFSPMQRERALGAVMGKIEGSSEGVGRLLGHQITDEFGHVSDMTGTMREIQAWGRKSDINKRRLTAAFGSREATEALMHTDFQKIRAEEDAGPSRAPVEALSRLKNSDFGHRMANEVKKNQAMQGNVGADSMLGGISDFIGGVAAESPILTSLGLGVGAKLAGTGLRTAAAKFGLGGAKAAGTVEAAAAGEGGGGLFAGLAGLGASGLAAGGVLGVGALAAGKVLAELGTASAARQGFTGRAIDREHATVLSGRAAAAEAGAAGARSPGQQAALAADQQMRSMNEMIQTLLKAGASLQLAQESAQQLIALGSKPTVVQVINATGGEVDATLRGEQ